MYERAYARRSHESSPYHSFFQTPSFNVITTLNHTSHPNTFLQAKTNFYV